MTRLYTDLAAWWPLLSSPADHAEEADSYRRTLIAACESPPRTMLGDLRLAVETAYVHCRPGGAALFAPERVPFDHSELEPGTYELFVGRRR